jgi:hypothetical protein
VTRKSVMLVSQQNAGSTWLAGCVRLACPDLRGMPDDREWFNPAWNSRYQVELAKVFGGELPYLIENLTRTPLDVDLESVLRIVWDPVGRDFTKETYLSWQLECEPLRRRFSYIGLVRSVEESFPAYRGRMKVWYVNWYYSLRQNGWLTPYHDWLDQHVKTAEDMALIAWQMVRWYTDKVFERLHVPVLVYHHLMVKSQSHLEEYLTSKHLDERINPRALARVMALTRQPKKRAEQYMDQWKEAFTLLEQFVQQTEHQTYRGMQCG